MEQQEFYEQIKHVIEELLGEDYYVSLSKIQKIGFGQLDVLCIKNRKQSIMPIIYLQDYYIRFQQGKEVRMLAKEIVTEYFQKSMYQEKALIGLDFLNQKEQIEQQLFFRCFPTNQVPLDIPHKEMLDLSIVYGILIHQQKDATTFITITEKLREEYGWTEEELFDLAMENTPNLFPESVRTLREMLTSILSPMEQTSSFHNNKSKYEMLILSNTANFYGFSAVFYPNVLEQLAEERKENLIVIPSSIHEAIVLADLKEVTIQELNETIVTVNETQLKEQEQLSNQAYYYDRETKSLYFMENYKKGERQVCVKF